MTWTHDWSPTNIATEVFTYAAHTFLVDTANKPSGATAALAWAQRPPDSVAKATTLLSTTVTTTASGTVGFQYRVSSESGSDGLRFYIDGTQQALYSGTVAWTAASFTLAAGTHTLEWAYTKDGGGLSGTDDAAIALLTVSGAAQPSVATTAPSTTWNFEDGTIPSIISTTTWTNSTSSPISGTHSMRSTATAANSGSYSMTITPGVTATSVVSYDWKTDSEANFDWLTVVHGSTAANYWVTRQSGATSGTSYAIVASGGTLTAIYAKDAGGSVGADAAWIDNVKIYTPAAAGTTYAAAGASAGVSGVAGAVSALLLAAGLAVGVTGVAGNPARVPRTFAAAGAVAGATTSAGTVALIVGSRTYDAAGAITGASGSSGTVQLTTSAAGTVAGTSAASGTVQLTAGASGVVNATTAIHGAAAIASDTPARDIDVTASPVSTSWQVMGTTGYPVTTSAVNNNNGYAAGATTVDPWAAAPLINQWSTGPVWIQES